MARAFTLSRAMKQKDILDTNAQALVFRNMNKVPGFDAQGLTIRCVNFVAPSSALGQIRVGLWNQIRAFRGPRDIGNRFTASIYEVVGSPTLNSLHGWQELCANSRTDDGLLQEEYSATCRMEQYDPKGNVSYYYEMLGVWPMAISPPQQTEHSGASRVELTFSVDFCNYFRMAAN